MKLFQCQLRRWDQTWKWVTYDWLEEKDAWIDNAVRVENLKGIWTVQWVYRKVWKEKEG